MCNLSVLRVRIIQSLLDMCSYRAYAGGVVIIFKHRLFIRNFACIKIVHHFECMDCQSSVGM